MVHYNILFWLIVSPKAVYAAEIAFTMCCISFWNCANRLNLHAYKNSTKCECRTFILALGHSYHIGATIIITDVFCCIMPVWKTSESNPSTFHKDVHHRIYILLHLGVFPLFSFLIAPFISAMFGTSVTGCLIGLPVILSRKDSSTSVDLLSKSSKCFFRFTTISLGLATNLVASLLRSCENFDETGP